jgi:hypothetical protein
MQSATITTDGSRVIFLGVQAVEGDCGPAHRVASFERVLADGSTAAFVKAACPACEARAAELAAFIRSRDIRRMIQDGARPAPCQAAEWHTATYGE